MTYTITRTFKGLKYDGVYFAFRDRYNNHVSVPLTQKQVDEYRDALDQFSTTPLKSKGTKS